MISAICTSNFVRVFQGLLNLRLTSHQLLVQVIQLLVQRSHEVFGLYLPAASLHLLERVLLARSEALDQQLRLVLGFGLRRTDRLLEGSNALLADRVLFQQR